MNKQNQNEISGKLNPIVKKTNKNIELPTVEQLAHIAAILLASNSPYQTLMNKRCEAIACKALVLWSACHNVIFGDDYDFIRDPHRLAEFVSGRNLHIPPAHKSPLANVLSDLMPGLNEDASYPIYRRFLKHLHPEMDAIEKMTELKQNGVLKDDAESNIKLFNKWRENEISCERRISGNKSAMVRKNKKTIKQTNDKE
jgi:hypothetical protein